MFFRLRRGVGRPAWLACGRVVVAGCGGGGGGGGGGGAWDPLDCTSTTALCAPVGRMRRRCCCELGPFSLCGHDPTPFALCARPYCSWLIIYRCPAAERQLRGSLRTGACCVEMARGVRIVAWAEPPGPGGPAGFGGARCFLIKRWALWCGGGGGAALVVVYGRGAGGVSRHARTRGAEVVGNGGGGGGDFARARPPRVACWWWWWWFA